MKHTVLEQSSFQNYTLLTFVQKDVHRQATYCCLLMTKAKEIVVSGTDWTLLLSNDSIILPRQEHRHAESC